MTQNSTGLKRFAIQKTDRTVMQLLRGNMPPKVLQRFRRQAGRQTKSTTRDDTMPAIEASHPKRRAAPIVASRRVVDMKWEDPLTGMSGNYTGDVDENDHPHGSGVARFPNGHVFKGQWVEGVKKGNGKYTWPSGAEYIGDFEHNHFQGHGAYYWPDGEHFSGMFLGGKQHGLGTLYYADGKSCYCRQAYGGSCFSFASHFVLYFFYVQM